MQVSHQKIMGAAMSGSKIESNYLQRDNLLTSSATPTRLGLAEPTRLPTNQVRQIETRDQNGELIGSILVDGKYGQTHEDLIEIVRYLADFHIFENGQLKLIIDPHKVRRAMAYGKSGKSTVKKSTPKFSADGCSQLEDDLLKVLVKLNTSNGRVVIKTKAHIVEKIVVAEDVKNTDPVLAAMLSDSYVSIRGGIKRERSLQMWIFSDEYTKLLNDDIPRYYDPRPLCMIKSGSVAAMARHVLTHQYMPKGGWKERELMRAAKITRRHDKVEGEVITYAYALEKLGIKVVDHRWFLMG